MALQTRNNTIGLPDNAMLNDQQIDLFNATGHCS